MGEHDSSDREVERHLLLIEAAYYASATTGERLAGFFQGEHEYFPTRSYVLAAFRADELDTHARYRPTEKESDTVRRGNITLTVYKNGIVRLETNHPPQVRRGRYEDVRDIHARSLIEETNTRIYSMSLGSLSQEYSSRAFTLRRANNGALIVLTNAGMTASRMVYGKLIPPIQIQP